jgi:hypothetical protein
MRILFDENLNRRLRRALPGHEITTVQELGWAGTKNGILVRKAVDAALTCCSQGTTILSTSKICLLSQSRLSFFACEATGWKMPFH